jgi:predicted DNA binding CopG/RHH family protein
MFPMSGQKSGEKREKSIGVRVNDHEERIAKKRASEAGISVAEAMRRLLLQSSRGDVRGSGGTKRDA